MKLFLSLLSIILLVLCLGCSSKDQSFGWYLENGNTKVLSTTAMIDDLVAKIGGEYVDHIPLMKGEIDPHSYELVKGDDEKIGRADLIIANGLNLEHGASLQYQLHHHQHVIFIGDEIQKRVPENILLVKGEIDPHVWMDISLWAEGIDAIVAALSIHDPAHTKLFENNGQNLKKEMLKTHQEIREFLQKIPEERRFLVTSHDAFHYFCRAYLAKNSLWEERCMAPEGLAPEGQLSSVDIQRVVEHLCHYKIHVVFPETNVSRDALKKIVSCCSAKGLQVRISQQSLYGDAMGGDGSEANSYLDMIWYNAKILKREWDE